MSKVFLARHYVIRVRLFVSTIFFFWIIVFTYCVSVFLRLKSGKSWSSWAFRNLVLSNKIASALNWRFRSFVVQHPPQWLEILSRKGYWNYIILSWICKQIFKHTIIYFEIIETWKFHQNKISVVLASLLNRRFWNLYRFAARFRSSSLNLNLAWYFSSLIFLAGKKSSQLGATGSSI